MGLLDELVSRITEMPPEDRKELGNLAVAATSNMMCFPDPDNAPQMEAYFCEADELYYGGEAGGGKSFLLQALALNEHTKSLLLRRQGKEAFKFFESLEEIIGSSNGRNKSAQNPHWSIGDKTIDIGGCQYEDDKENYKGIPHDLIGFDEIPDFTFGQFSFIKTWCRTTKPGQRFRIVCAGNPPTRPSGLWVIDYWAPWLNPKHPNPAKSGEIRWFIVDKNDVSHEVAGPGAYRIDHENDIIALIPDTEFPSERADGPVEYVRARSRCFIRAGLKDNKYLNRTGYGAALDALPAEIRAAYRDGRFDRSVKDDPWQIIPTEWVLAAQARWEQHPHPPTLPGGAQIPMCAMAADVAQGGADETVISKRYDLWFDKNTKVPGKLTPRGNDVAGLIIADRKDNAAIVIDLGGGYGGEAYGTLKDQLEAEGYQGETIVHAYKGGDGTTKRTKDGKFGFKNRRAATLWNFRELLDPGQNGGSRVMLPPGNTRLVAGLTAAKFWVEGSLICVTPKDSPKEGVETVRKILGYSPDDADSVTMCAEVGAIIDSHYGTWKQGGRGFKKPTVNHGPLAARKRYLR